MTKKRRPVLRFLFTALIVLWSVNFVASLLVDGRAAQRQWIPKVSAKSKRPSLEDQDLARQVYREFGLLETRYAPFVGWSRKPFAGEVVTVNEAGDREHGPLPRAPLGYVRFFGGSTMWGSGVDDANTIPAHFDALLPGYAVVNHGESGFISRQSLARLVDLVGQGEPMDLVIFYDGCNDLYTLCREDVGLTGHREQEKMARKLEKVSAVANGLVGSTLEVARAIAGEVADHDPEVLCSDEEHARRVARALVNNWKMAHRIAELGGAELHAFLQPVACLGTPSVEYLGDPQKGRRAECYMSVYPLVQEMIRAEGVDWMHDVTDAFDVEGYLYIDTCHVNGRGNQIIAERMDALVGHVLRNTD